MRIMFNDSTGCVVFSDRRKIHCNPISPTRPDMDAPLLPLQCTRKARNATLQHKVVFKSLKYFLELTHCRPEHPNLSCTKCRWQPRFAFPCGPHKSLKRSWESWPLHGFTSKILTLLLPPLCGPLTCVLKDRPPLSVLCFYLIALARKIPPQLLKVAHPFPFCPSFTSK